MVEDALHRKEKGAEEEMVARDRKEIVKLKKINAQLKIRHEGSLLA